MAEDDGERYPLRLCEVLEQEFGALHGRPLPPADWLLQPDDLDAARLLERLRSTEHDFPDSPARCICQRLAREGPAASRIDALLKGAPPSSPEAAASEAWAHAEPLREGLNDLLQQHHPLYEPAWLRPDAEPARLHALRAPAPVASVWQSLHRRWRACRHPHQARTATTVIRPASGDDPVQLNRLLLEAAFDGDVVRRVDQQRLARLWRAVHAMDRDARAPLVRSALCLSGGGIRSAAFALGGVQALARHGLLTRFDYLSTVSGGGYLGSWLSTWAHRQPGGVADVAGALKRNRDDAAADGRRLDGEPAPLHFLRSYSRFLNPRAGLLSLDTWTWIGLYLRNLFLNWLVLIPLLLAVLTAPRLYASLLGELIRLEPAAAQGVLVGLAWLATATAVCTVTCVIVNRPSAGDPARRPLQPAAVRTAAATWADRWRLRLKQPGAILLLGVGPLLLFSTVQALVAGYESVHPLPLRLLPGTPSLVQAMAPLMLERMQVWGAGVVALAWLLSLALLPGAPWRVRLGELVALVAAGGLTWAVVARLQAFLPSLLRDTAYPLFDGALLRPLHLHVMLGAPATVLAVLAGMTLFIGLVSKQRWIEDEDREWWARFGAWALLGALGWVAAAALVIAGPMLLYRFPALLSALGGVSGLAAVLLGRSALSPAAQRGAAPMGRVQAALAQLGMPTTALLSGLFLALFLSALSLGTSHALQQLGLVELPGAVPAAAPAAPTGLAVNVAVSVALAGDGAVAAAPAVSASATASPRAGATTPSGATGHADVVRHTPLLGILTFLAAVALAAALAGLLINLNKFSLHAAYRLRIARTFLGASRGARRRPNPFTGFDPMDNVAMHELQPGLLREIDIRSGRELVRRLRDALTPAADPAAPLTQLAQRVCGRRHDRSGYLRARLERHDDDQPVLSSLQQDLLETLNRVLETEPLPWLHGARAPARAGATTVAPAEILANRRALDALLGRDVLAPYSDGLPPHRLMHVLNLTLNLVRGRTLAWQERKAAPFTVSPLHSGTYYLGYRPSRSYGSRISIATAAAISGAAVSPNMGYSSSPLTSLLLTLFNVRLGWWLGNPGADGRDTFWRKEPRFSLRPLLSEALGLTDDRSPYVYLSDGGHFENLGLFEMVLRRCRVIVVLDAGADPLYRFDDLGNAVRKIALDLGIPIEFDAMPVRKWRGEADDGSGRYATVGRIRYAEADGADAREGVLVYLKPVLCGSEPRDVLYYASQHPEFPHEATSDQFFGEAQFEAYRRLACHALDRVLQGLDLDAGPVLDGPAWAQRLEAAVRRHAAAAVVRPAAAPAARRPLSPAPPAAPASPSTPARARARR